MEQQLTGQMYALDSRRDNGLGISNETAPKLLYLSQSDLISLGADSSDTYVDAVSQGLALHIKGEAVQPLKPYLRWPTASHIADRIIAMPCYLGGENPIAGIKWIGSREANEREYNLPRASAVIVLNDVDTNYPVAVMEGALISGMRTAAVTAIAARYLALSDFSAIACIGCGPIAKMQLKTMLQQFPSISHMHLYDFNSQSAENMQSYLKEIKPSLNCKIESNARAAVCSADVVITCTTTAEPYIEYSWLKPGVFISNVSIMDVHKEVYEKADKVVVDDWEQSNRERKIINQLVLEGRFSREKLYAELGELVVGAKPGRESEREVILLNAMGMAVDDMVCAQRFYELAEKQSIGTALPLF